MICDECQALYEEVGDRARDAGVFGKVRRTDEMLKCAAKNCESEAMYYVWADPDGHEVVYVGLTTPDRWLSESIEADLMHQGDDLEELLEEELFDQGFETRLPVEHFRDDKKLYTFRSPIILASDQKPDAPEVIDQATQALLAYEACFRELGDMVATDEPV